MKYEPVPERRPGQLDPDYVPVTFKNTVHCRDVVTGYGDTIQAGHYYQRRDGVWTCKHCGATR